ncbi:MAG: hypothetical protein HEEMFOPI_01736 [Holosporales bacterium]
MFLLTFFFSLTLLNCSYSTDLFLKNTQANHIPTVKDDTFLKEMKYLSIRETETEKKKYLFLPNLGSQKNYVISMCPMNSSGDWYHILAYVLLAKSHSKDVPPIQLTFDSDENEQTSESKMNNYTAAWRTINFAKAISCREFFLDPLYLNPSVNSETGEKYKEATYQQNVRQHNLTHTLKPQLSFNTVHNRVFLFMMKQTKILKKSSKKQMMNI